MYSNKYAHVLHTLREEILAARNFGGSLNPPNRVQFGGINFGGSEKIMMFVMTIIHHQLCNRTHFS